MKNPQRGTVLQVPTGDSAGLLFLDGQQIPFQLAQVWQSPVAPATNQTVEVSLDDGGKPARILVIDAQTLAKEKLGQFAGLAGDHSQQAAAQGMAVLQIVRSRMGLVPMIAAAMLFIGWFFLPALTISPGFGITKSFSVSDILGIQLSSSGAESSFGFWAFLGLVAVLVPWAVAWLRPRWTSLLHAAPLVMLILAFVRVRWQLHSLVSQAIDAAGQMGGGQAQAMVQSMVAQMGDQISKAVSFGFGFWLVLLFSLVLAFIGFKRYSTHA